MNKNSKQHSPGIPSHRSVASNPNQVALHFRPQQRVRHGTAAKVSWIGLHLIDMAETFVVCCSTLYLIHLVLYLWTNCVINFVISYRAEWDVSLLFLTQHLNHLYIIKAPNVETIISQAINHLESWCKIDQTLDPNAFGIEFSTITSIISNNAIHEIIQFTLAIIVAVWSIASIIIITKTYFIQISTKCPSLNVVIGCVQTAKAHININVDFSRRSQAIAK